MGKYKKLMALLFLGLAALPSFLSASPILGEPILGGRILVAQAGEVKATFLGSDAGYFNTLYLAAPDGGFKRIFDKKTDIGRTVILDTFVADTELVFRLYVHNTGLAYYTGDATRNPDGLPHTLAVTSFDKQLELFVTDIGFEDLYGGGDKDYNDFKFRLTNTIDPPIPEPSVLALLGIGITGVGYARRRKLRKL